MNETRMLENAGRGERRGGDRGRADFLTLVLAVGLAHLFAAWELLPTGESILVAWPVAYGIGYWLPPRPRESYARWLLGALLIAAAFYLAFFKVPALLKPLTPTAFAYGLPAVLFFAWYVWSIVRAKPVATEGRAGGSSEMRPRR